MGGIVSTGTGGTSVAPSSGGGGGAAGAFSTGVGGAAGAFSTGAGGMSVVLPSGGAGGTDGAFSAGGVLGTDAALSSGGTVGTVDVVADSTGEAGGAGGKSILDLVPLDDTVSGWKVDRTIPPTADQRAVLATTEEEVASLIDGGAVPFFMSQYQPKVFAWQNYVNATLPAAPDGAQVVLFILQMASAGQAAGLYQAVLASPLYSRKANTPDDWQDPTTPRLGTDSRIQDTGVEWWINFYKDVYYVEVMLNPSYGPAPDYVPGSPVTKAEALRFAQAVASQI